MITKGRHQKQLLRVKTSYRKQLSFWPGPDIHFFHVVKQFRYIVIRHTNIITSFTLLVCVEGDASFSSCIEPRNAGENQQFRLINALLTFFAWYKLRSTEKILNQTCLKWYICFKRIPHFNSSFSDPWRVKSAKGGWGFRTSAKMSKIPVMILCENY